jgi:long-subunit acyl-CoA synthetase (AMP-forming)
MTSTAITTSQTTLCELFAATAAERSDEVALRTADGAVELTWAEYAAQARAVSAGLAGLGVERGETVACWLGNRPEFHVADAGALGLGAAPFSVYPTFTAEQATHVIRDAGSRVLVTEPQHFEQALAIRDSGATAVESIVLVEGSDARALTWDELLACAPAGFDYEAWATFARPDDLATLIYTSGTTGPPKGVQLTHRNVVSQLAALGERLELPAGLRAISWLPMAHVAERLCTHYFPLARGWQVTTCSEPREIAAVIARTRPGFFFSPPRLWEKLRSAVLAGADEATRRELEQAVGRVRAGEGVQNGALAAAITARLGFDELEVAIVGAAPCPPEVIEFWHAIGIALGEVYGMSESTGVATVNPPAAIRVGTTGTALAGVEVKLSERDEILIRGPVVMPGYRNSPTQTAEAVDEDGWLHTGDVGILDGDGYLRIVDRIKELIINAAGKNMSPANIEAAIKSAGGIIGQVCAIGDRRPYNTALITLDPDGVRAFAARHGLDGATPTALAVDERVRAEVADQVGRANQRLARAEQIKDFVLLGEDWAPGGDELTPTMKLKRKPIAEKYAAQIAALYGAR